MSQLHSSGLRNGSAQGRLDERRRSGKASWRQLTTFQALASATASNAAILAFPGVFETTVMALKLITSGEDTSVSASDFERVEGTATAERHQPFLNRVSPPRSGDWLPAE
eukprot:scaffold111_cov252-Pinguiococcus_pyrenoidosus.AAC.2